jgi:predicted Zn-dependent protease
MLLAACASGEKTRYREGDNAGQQVDLTPQEEKRLADEALQQMQKDYPKAKDPYLQNYINGIGRKLVAANNLQGNPYDYNFAIVDVPQVNAFALPAGTIFVTAPLIEMADSEAELAGVVGHEIGHVKARHAAERMYVAKREQGKTWLFALGGAVLGGAAGYGLGRALCPPADKKCQQRALQLGAAAGVGGGLLVQKYKFMSNSREDEMEADRIGFQTSVRAGYDREHVGRFYAKLLTMEKKAKASADPVSLALNDALSTHPPSQERVNQMAQLADASKVGVNGRVSSPDFARARQAAARLAEAARARAKG